jgi:hypothetical protein
VFPLTLVGFSEPVLEFNGLLGWRQPEKRVSAARADLTGMKRSSNFRDASALDASVCLNVELRT